MTGFRVLYLTGAPSTGKSTAVSLLKERIKPLVEFDYGAAILKHLTHRHGREISYEELRGSSSSLCSPDDIAKIDEQLISWVAAERSRTSIVIDSHAVTRESYGFRLTPFSAGQLQLLKPDVLVSLFVPPEVASARIGAGLGGRLAVTPFEAGFHAGTQAALLATYSVLLGTSAHLVDAAATPDVVAGRLAELMAQP